MTALLRVPVELHGPEAPAAVVPVLEGPVAVVEAWPHLAPFLAAAVERPRSGLTMDHAALMLVTGQWVAWRVYVDGEMMAVATTQVVEDAVHVITVGGSRWSRWGATLERTLRRYARDLGKTKIVAHCRPGMARWLEELDWEHVMTVVAKEVESDG